MVMDGFLFFFFLICDIGSTFFHLDDSFLKYVFRYHSTFRAASKMTKEATPFERLPSSVTPINYDLELKPSLSDFTFDGRVVIDVKVNKTSTVDQLQTRILFDIKRGHVCII